MIQKLKKISEKLLDWTMDSVANFLIDRQKRKLQKRLEEFTKQKAKK